MRNSLLLTKNIVALVALLGFGCSSTRTHVDTGPIHAGTFSFIAAAPNNSIDAPFVQDPWAPVHGFIQESITRNLAQKGLLKTASGGDVTVAYLVIAGNNGNTTAIDTYFGRGRNASGLEDKAHAAYNSSKNPNYFEAGTLLVDFVDTKTGKLLKRSYVVRPLLRNPSAELRGERIQEAVDSVLQDVRIVH